MSCDHQVRPVCCHGLSVDDEPCPRCERGDHHRNLRGVCPSAHDYAPVVKRLRQRHRRDADDRGSDRSQACDKSEHDTCRGTVAMMDQDGVNHYLCSCHCHTTYSCCVCKTRWPCDVAVLIEAVEAAHNESRSDVLS